MTMNGCGCRLTSERRRKRWSFHTWSQESVHQLRTPCCSRTCQRSVFSPPPWSSCPTAYTHEQSGCYVYCQKWEVRRVRACVTVHWPDGFVVSSREDLLVIVAPQSLFYGRRVAWNLLWSWRGHRSNSQTHYTTPRITSSWFSASANITLQATSTPVMAQPLTFRAKFHNSTFFFGAYLGFDVSRMFLWGHSELWTAPSCADSNHLLTVNKWSIKATSSTSTDGTFSMSYHSNTCCCGSFHNKLLHCI